MTFPQTLLLVNIYNSSNRGCGYVEKYTYARPKSLWIVCGKVTIKCGKVFLKNLGDNFF